MNKDFRNQLLTYIDRLLIFYSVLAFLASIFFYFREKEILNTLPYSFEATIYIIIRYFLKSNKQRLLYVFLLIKSIFVISHIVFAILNPWIVLIEYLTLLQGIVLITALFSIIIKNQPKISITVLLLYFGVLILFGLFSPIAFKEYHKVEWIRGCIINSKDGNLQLGVSVDRTADNCKCVYLKFKERYRSAKFFPSHTNYSKTDKIDVFNCTVDFLIPDSLNKDSVRNNIQYYIK